MSVIDLATARQERQPHWVGTAHCVGCRHEWDAVAPIGTSHLECPSCGLPKGFPKHPFGGAEGDLMLTCSDCGSEAMTAYKSKGRLYVRCMGCGVDLTDAFYEG